MIKKICICGAGTMGSGIAQVSAQSGFDTTLFDINETVLEKSKQGIKKKLQHLSDKKKISVQEERKIFENIKFVSQLKECIGDFIIEAIAENVSAKVKLFNELAEVNGSAVVFASNTSSLSISQIQQDIPFPERVVGMHIFNPATAMKLVEIIKGDLTSEETIRSVETVCKQLGKFPVICMDTPGFIVNRVARHYYLEALRLIEEQNIPIENIDSIMEATGFKIGPFKLMDLIGVDINLSVSQSIYEAFNKEPRFEPSLIQVDKVKNGDLGKKTGKGFYSYQ
jgi:3-hydroxybutyryl-CoA dehydrogenase